VDGVIEDDEDEWETVSGIGKEGQGNVYEKPITFFVEEEVRSEQDGRRRRGVRCMKVGERAGGRRVGGGDAESKKKKNGFGRRKVSLQQRVGLPFV